MRFISADYLYTLDLKPIKNGVLQLNNFGEITNIFKNKAEIPNQNIEFFNGILCPGFINAHCHLELSHLHNISKSVNGFSEFLKIVKKRDKYSQAFITRAIKSAEAQMIKNGIVGVGDICNTTDTLEIKKNKKLYYYNFIEAFEVSSKKSSNAITKALLIRDAFRNNNLKATITPHSPYCVTPDLMKLIANVSDEFDYTFSMHNQETEEENILFKNKKGKFHNWLKSLNASAEIWNDRSSSYTVLDELRPKRIILVHNTYSSSADLKDKYYCTCPCANLFIENKLPNYSIFNSDNLCVGTDSLASNNQLSIIKELALIQENSNFSLEELLKIGCKNGANALGFYKYGTIEVGKTPGINLITGSEFGLANSKVKRIA